MDIKEYIIPLEGDNFHQGRIVVYANSNGFNCDVLITNIESGKIFVSVKQLFNFSQFDDLLQTAVQCLSNYLAKSTEISLPRSSKDLTP